MMNLTLESKKIWMWLGLFVLLEFLSALFFFWRPGENVWFLLASLVILFFSIKDFRFAWYAVLVDLSLGSLGGRWFFYSYHDFEIPIRFVLFVVFLLAFAVHILVKKNALHWNRNTFILYLLPAFAVALGFVRGIAGGNQFTDVFADGNAYLFLLLAPGIYLILHEKKSRVDTVHLLAALNIMLFLLTFGTALIYAYQLNAVIPGLYSWIRDLRIGEITHVSGNFFRVFLQAQIFSLLGMIVWGVWLLFLEDQKKKTTPAVLFFLSSMTVFMSFSRSFWIGALVGITALMFLLVLSRKISVFAALRSFGLVSMMLSFQIALIFLLVSAPFANSLGSRLFDFSEAAASSRVNQFRPLVNAVMEHPVLGSGFGTPVTYVSNDPRVRKQNPLGIVTSTHFELGFLDMLLDNGAIGMIMILFPIGVFLIEAMKRLFTKKINPASASVLIAGFAAIMSVHFFSPYLDHPLGIGFSIFLISFFSDSH